VQRSAVDHRAALGEIGDLPGFADARALGWRVARALFCRQACQAIAAPQLLDVPRAHAEEGDRKINRPVRDRDRAFGRAV
jgi:hypothetical protein